tara:strand:- start:690 stop:3131 length:2442 start_codon:yes stop_codon:yes gene_type:complete
MDFAKKHKLVAMKDAKGNPLYAKESVELEEKATRTAVDKEFNKVTRSGKMDTLRAIRHVEKKFKIKDVKVQKDKNGKSHVISFDESAVAQSKKNIRRTFKFPSDRQAKQFEYDISNSGVAIGNRVGNKVTVKTGLDRRTAQAVAKYMKKSKGKMIKESIEEGSLGYKKALRSKNTKKKGMRSGNEREKAMDYRRWSAEKLRNKNIHSDHQLYPDPQDPKDVKKKLVNPLSGKGYPYNESIDEASEKQMIDMLRKEYGKLSKVDPSQPTYKKLTALLDKIAKVNPGLLKKLAKAKIKFVSTLAQNRLNEELNEEARAFDNKNEAKRMAYKLAKRTGEGYTVLEISQSAGGQGKLFQVVSDTASDEWNRKMNTRTVLRTAYNESVELEEMMESTPAYRKMMKNYAKSDDKKVFDILKDKGWKVHPQDDTLVRNMIKRNKGNVKKAAAEIEKRYSNRFESVELDEKRKPKATTFTVTPDYEFDGEKPSNYRKIKTLKIKVDARTMAGGYEEVEEYISDEISDTTGWLHNGFTTIPDISKVTESVELDEAGDPRIAKMSDKGRKLLASLANVMDTTGGPYLDDKNVKFLTKQGVNATIKAADKAKLGGPGQRYLALIKKELGESIEEDTFKKKAVRDVKAKYDPKIDALKKRIADLKTKMDLKKSVKTSSSTLDALKTQHAAARKKREDAEAKVKASQERLKALRAKLNNSFDPMEDRDYKKEYANFHGKPEQRAKRSKRVLARREMIKSGKAKKGDGKDVDHKDGNANNNSPSNLRMMSVAKNRSRNNNKQHEEHGAGDEGTNKLIKKYKKDTPGA